MSEIKLKPCPFCGGKAIIRSLQEYCHNELINEKYSAVCENKRCIARNCNKYFKTAGEAAEAWNRRAEPEGGRTS